MYESRFHRAARVQMSALVLMLVAAPVVVTAQVTNDPPATSIAAEAIATATTTAASEAASAQVTTEAIPIRGLPEPVLLQRGIDYATEMFGDDTGTPGNGFYPELSNMITGSGFVSVGPGYRHFFAGDHLFFDTSAAVSWHFYKMVQGRLEFVDKPDGHFVAGAQTMWQDATQVSYFGEGSNVVNGSQSQYRLRTTDVVGYASVKPVPELSFNGEFGWLRRPEVMSPAGTFNPGHPATPIAFPEAPGVMLAEQPNYLHGEASVVGDTRDHRGYPTSGGLYRGTMTMYSDRSAGTFSFEQYEGELAQFVPLFDKHVVLAAHGWTMFSNVGSGHDVPFYLLPFVGGNNTLRGYDDYEFHERNALLASGEVRIALMMHVDAAVFYDAGSVARRYADLNFDKTDWGAGLRLHTSSATFARLDFAHGSEGWRVVLRTNEPFKFSAVTRKLAAVPFMP